MCCCFDAFNRLECSPPLHEHLGWVGIYGWPRLLVEVYYEDEHNRMDLGETMLSVAVIVLSANLTLISLVYWVC